MSTDMIVVMSATVPVAGMPAFRSYEAAVLPLLHDFGATLERRLRSEDGTREIHIVRFSSRENLDRFRADPRRSNHAHLLALSGAKTDVTVMRDVAPHS